MNNIVTIHKDVSTPSNTEYVVEQRSLEWFLERWGKVTASQVHNVYDRTLKGEPTAKYARYKMRLIVERLFPNLPPKSYVSEAAQWGIYHEKAARLDYEFIYDKAVTTCGFFRHPTIPNCGASPDGLIDTDGLIEIKCPNSETHLNFVLNEEIKPEYISQMQFQMACTGRQWCDFVSYDPRFQGDFSHLVMKVQRVYRDENVISEMNNRVIQFLEEVEADISKILTLRNTQPKL